MRVTINGRDAKYYIQEAMKGTDNGICEKRGKFNDIPWVDVAKWRIGNEGLNGKIQS